MYQAAPAPAGAPLPLNITLSIGDVNFHITPSPAVNATAPLSLPSESPSRRRRHHHIHNVHTVRRVARRKRLRDKMNPHDSNYGNCQNFNNPNVGDYDEEGSDGWGGGEDDDLDERAHHDEHLEQSSPILTIRHAPQNTTAQPTRAPIHDDNDSNRQRQRRQRHSSALFSSNSQPHSINNANGNNNINNAHNRIFSPLKNIKNSNINNINASNHHDDAPTSPKSPIHNYILGRVRAMKDKIESSSMDAYYNYSSNYYSSNNNHYSKISKNSSSNSNRRKSAPIYSNNNYDNNCANENLCDNSRNGIGGNNSNQNNANDYCVDLHSFTGTLRISSNPFNSQAMSSVQSAQPMQTNQPVQPMQITHPNDPMQPMQSAEGYKSEQYPRDGVSHKGEDNATTVRTAAAVPNAHNVAEERRAVDTSCEVNDGDNVDYNSSNKQGKNLDVCKVTHDSATPTATPTQRTQQQSFTWIVSDEDGVETGIENIAVDTNAATATAKFEGKEGLKEEEKNAQMKSLNSSNISCLQSSLSERKESASSSSNVRKSVQFRNDHAIIDTSATNTKAVDFLEAQQHEQHANGSDNEDNNDPPPLRSPNRSNTQRKIFFPSPPSTTNAADTIHANRANVTRFTPPLHPPPRTAISATAKSIQTSATTSMQYARQTSRFVMKQVKHYGLAGRDIYGEIQNSLISPSLSNQELSQSISPLGSSRSAGGGGMGIPEEEDGTELHRLCASGTLADIRNFLENDNEKSINTTTSNISSSTVVEDLSTPNSKGLLPIHIFTTNEALILSDLMEAEEVAMLMVQRMGPEKAIQSLHPPCGGRLSSGWAPFVYIIGKWVMGLHRDATPQASLLLSAVRGTVIKHHPLEPSSPVAASAAVDGDSPVVDEEQTRALPASSSSTGDPSQPSRLRKISVPFFGPNANDRSTLISSTFVADRDKSLYLPPSVEIPDHVKWAIHILSRLINEFTEETRSSILTNIASIPLFLKSVFLVNDAQVMMMLMDTSLVKNAIVDRRSINLWLIAMLIGKREIKMRAVTFLKLLSRLTIIDLNSSSQHRDRYSDQEIERFIRLRKDAFTAIYVMPGIFPAVLALGARELEQMSTTRIMRYITDKAIRKERVFIVLMFDFFASIFLLIGYRLKIEFVLNYNNEDGPAEFRDRSFLTVSTNGVAGYLLLKEIMTIISLYLTSLKLARRYFLTIFNLIDMASLLLLLGSSNSLKSETYDIEGFAASLTIVLLWLRLMGSFKILNSSFSLFLYAVVEVVKEIKWFLFFLISVTFMFSDAARTVVVARGDCQDLQDDPEVMKEFCSDKLFAINILMYAVLAGDVSLDYFQSSEAMIAVFAFFTFFCIIILLNILIAIIMESYEKSRQRANELFGRARVEYAAHLRAREQFLSPKEHSDFHVATYVPRTARIFFRVSYVIVSLVALASIEYGFAGAVKYLDVNDYSIIRSLSIFAVAVGAIFNAYMISFLCSSLFSRYRRRKPDAGKGAVSKIVWIMECGLNLFHQLLGFNTLDLSATPEFENSEVIESRGTLI